MHKLECIQGCDTEDRIETVTKKYCLLKHELIVEEMHVVRQHFRIETKSEVKVTLKLCNEHARFHILSSVNAESVTNKT